MGLAASQARFLSLTARKSNIEYEGQQINQQRTALSNQSASYYSSMLSLTVPTPPSSDSFKKTVYSFKVQGTTYTLGQITPSSEKDKYTVNYTTTAKALQMIVSGNEKVIKETEESVDKYYMIDGSTKKELITLKEYAAAHSNIIKEDDILSNFDNKYSNTEIYVVNFNDDEEENPDFAFFLQKNLPETNEEKSVNYYQETEVQRSEPGMFENVTITRDKNNRIVSMNIPDLSTSDIAIDTASILDEEAYNDAENEYNYQLYLYQQRMEEINAQTSIIQAKDKQLELRLKQLDTEESTIKAEIESVSNVLKNNIEKSYNTFA
ncbi:hypothetical protein IJG72_08545 [bacterium]|nr:hypothetical protein [bacterium]